MNIPKAQLRPNAKLDLGLQSTVLAFPPGPPPLDDKLPGWEDRACVSNLDIRRNIFCNRSLNMRSIKVRTPLTKDP